MKFSILLASALSVGLFACNNADKKAESGDQNAAFDQYKDHFVEALWKTYPGWASSSGFHKYDSILSIPDEAGRQAELAFAKAQGDSLAKYSIDQLNDNNKIDFQLIANQLKSITWGINDQKAFEWDPSGYNVCGGFAEMLNNNYDSVDNRLRNVALRLKAVPAYYEAAKANVKNPTVEHTQLAIDQNLGGSSVFTNDLVSALKDSKLSQAEKDSITADAARAVAAINGYASWLKALKNDHPRSFRLGKDLYNQKFDLEIQSGYTAEQIYAKALEHKKDLHSKMAAISREIWAKHMGTEVMPSDSLLMIRMLIDKLSVNHVKPADFQSAIDKQIPELVKFVNDKKLIYLDPSKPLVVRREPDYMAGVAGASISAPGPYDTLGNTYYNVGSLSGWDAAQSESYLREYNHYILQILNIHEAIPGHYTQLVYSNKSKSLIKSLLGNGAMVEGWAVYTERMMLENGYGNNEPEMWLMYYKWNLRTTCNTILDYSVHNLDMTKEDALSLLTKEAFQQQAEAEGKWKRATLSQVQLCSYFTGYKEIYDFREELKQKEGDKFDLKKFHETFLSYGSAPVKFIKTLMQ